MLKSWKLAIPSRYVFNGARIMIAGRCVTDRGRGGKEGEGEEREEVSGRGWMDMNGSQVVFSLG